MSKDDYTNRELDQNFKAIGAVLERIETQVTKTNGRVNKLERNMLVIACVVGTILLLKFPEVMKVLMIFL